MTRIHTLALLGGAVLALSACQKYNNAGAANSGANATANGAASADTGAIKDSIKNQEKQWNDEFQAKPVNVDALVGHYASDAYFVVPGQKHATGTGDIRKAYEGMAKDPNGNVTFASDKVDVAASGDLAYSRGHFTETGTDPNTKQKVSSSGSYLTVWKKQSDGSWKAVEDFTAVEPK
jgi:uncharacterized protein (TIGR02246 family)